MEPAPRSDRTNNAVRNLANSGSRARFRYGAPSAVYVICFQSALLLVSCIQKLRLWRALRRGYLVFMAMTVLVACTFLSPPTSQHAPLKMAYSLWPGYFPMAIAQEKGFFASQGVTVQTFYTQFTDGTQAADFAAGKYDGMTLALGNLIGLLSSNPTLQIVATIAQSKGADAVVAQPGISSVADLKDKTLGVQLGGFGELFISQMLSMNGLTTDQVRLNQVVPSNVPRFLRENRIQAGHVWEPFVSQLTQAGFPVVFTSAQTPGLIPDVIAFQKSTVKERPEDIRAFLRAWFQAVEYWQSHLEEGNTMIANTLNLKLEEVSLTGLQLLNLDDNQMAFTPGTTTASLYYTSQLYVDFAIRAGNLTRPPNLDQVLNPSFLERVNQSWSLEAKNA